MWPKVLSWVALVCNVLAVLFDIGFMAFTLLQPNEATLWGRLPGVILAGAFLLTGPVVTIFALLFGSPIARRYPAATPPADAFR
jgi:hypothetical protein